MSLVTRTGKGSKLTTAEMDGNLTYLESEAQKSQYTYEDITLDKDDWLASDDGYSQRISLNNSGVFEFGLPINTTFANTTNVANTGGIRVLTTTPTYITFEVKNLPTEDLYLTVKIK
jgi:hypothetical protein